MLKTVFHNKNNLMDYLYSIQNVALQYSTMSSVSPTVEHYMFNVTFFYELYFWFVNLLDVWGFISLVVLDGGGPGRSKST